ncbi:symplekin isoform X3 [Rhodamnia argentea]|uniref:Symplekin isoform X3 n=1 Tax=Rhodamnia argentea TaxID=178133 RepID=A0A8B8PR00_9MYRT|nr:symplekin isoform X3 [Rhodamnia argentea]
MVAIVAAATPRERLAGLVGSAKGSPDIPSKLGRLRDLKEDLLQDDPVLLAEFLPQLLDLLSDRFSPVRKFITQIIGEIGIKQLEFLPEMVPVLISVLDDESPPVARQAISCGIDLFRHTFERIAIQGLYTSDLDDSLESSWEWMLKFKDKVYSIAFQPGSDGIKLPALKFVQAIILLYTPDPNGSSEPPSDQRLEGNLLGFNASWLRGGHPILNVGDLATEASKNLVLLLDQLRSPTVKSLSYLKIVVLINSVSAIAKERPAYYGRILPVLLGLDPTSSVTKGAHVSGVRLALKNAFRSCLESTYPGVALWHDQLLDAVREMKDGPVVEQTLDQDYKINGSLEGKEEPSVSDEEKPSISPHDSTQISRGRKRVETEDHTFEVDVSGKRIKPSPSMSEESSNELNRKGRVYQEENASSGALSSKAESDSGTVHQLVAMFGALVAQGEKAVQSLEVIISTISADLLAEVVMANMCHLPSDRPKADEDEEGLQDVFSLSSAFPQISSILAAEQLQKPEKPDDLHVVAATNDVALQTDKTNEVESSISPTALPTSNDASAGTETGSVMLSIDIHEDRNLESEIPGLASSSHSAGHSENRPDSSLASMGIEDNGQEQDTSQSGKSLVESIPSISNDRYEELSPRPLVVDDNIPVSSSVTSVGLTSPVTLPKMSAPVIDLTDEQKDQLQKSAFTRIIETYKEVAVAGGSEARSSLLSYLGVEFPLELDPWILLHQHISSDYVNHEGHELTLHLLYRLFGEAEVERDFFSSTTASSSYESLLLNVAETLKDAFPPSDKSLNRLLGEVPHLPQSVLKLLGSLCSPGNVEKAEKELQAGDRVTQGLSAVWSLILLRPPIRDSCLKISLQSTVHHLEEVRMKAIRLVANKLYPLSSIAKRIEDFAKEMLLSVTSSGLLDKVALEGKDSDVERPLEERAMGEASNEDRSSDTSQLHAAESVAISEAQRCMSLYFALCTKRHSLFREVFVIYGGASTAAQQAIHRHTPILVRTMGPSSELLEIISDAPGGSENLLSQVLHSLTDGIVPSPELVLTVRKLYDSKLKDIEILMPILPFLPKDEVLLIFPRLVNLPIDKLQAALLRILTGSSHTDPLISPAEILIAIHGIDPDRDGIPLKKIIDACNACFEQRQMFTQPVVAKVLNQLVEQIPLPLLFMRTVLQAIGAFPALVDFVMEILSRLVSKQIWKYPKLWVGFLKCAASTKPQSFTVLLQLPPAQLENALNRMPALKEPLVAHASQPDIRSSLPRSLLVVLGIAPDSQAPSHVQASEAQTGDTGTSDKEVVNEKDSSNAS